MDLAFKFLLLLVFFQTVSQVTPICKKRSKAELSVDGRKCRKPCDKNADCRGTNKRCLCDGKCGKSCFNKGAKCSNLTEIPNGDFSVNFMTWGGTVLYSCHSGYYLEGTEIRRCHSDKEWHGEKPECIKADCEKPTRLGNGYPLQQDSGYNAGDVITYSCRSGYYTSGDITRTCTKSGWGPVHFNCTVKYCPRLPYIDHGSISFTKGFRFGSRATVNCDEGYELAELGTYKTCYPGLSASRFATWRGRLSGCNIKTCAAPDNLQNGLVIGGDFSRDYGDVVRYKCDRGFALRGPDSGVCNENATWGEIPICEVDPNCDFNKYPDYTCGFDASPENAWQRDRTQDPSGFQGYVLYTRGTKEAQLVSSTIPVEWARQYICIKFNYKLGSSSTTFEIKSASRESESWWEAHPNEQLNVWLDSFINRRMTGPIRYKFVYNFGVGYLDNVIVNEEKCVEHCFPNTCQNGGTCIDRTNGFSCFCTVSFTGKECEIDRRCPDPPAIENGKILDNDGRRLPGSTIRIQCNENYKLAGYSSIKTSVSTSCAWYNKYLYSRWGRNLKQTSCTEITCRNPLPSSNGRIEPTSEKWVVNDMVTFHCNVGYETRGIRTPVQSRCLNNGNWDRRAPRCSKVRCPAIDVDYMKERDLPNEYGDVVNIRCREGYQLNGDGRLRCLANRKWDHEQPTCERIPCPLVKNVENAKPFSKFQYRYLDRLEVVCKDDFRLVGQSPLSCEANGQWSSDMPTCQEIECLAPQTPSNGRMEPESKDKWFLDDFVTFRCNDGYEMEDNSNSRSQCLKTGQWSHPAAQCRKVGCPSIRFKNMIEEDLAREFGDSVQVRCRRGYRLIGQDLFTCLANKTWDHELPFCEEIVCDQPELPSNITITRGQMEDEYSVDATVSLVCLEEGKTPSPLSLTCLNDGRWTNTEISCIEVFCPLPVIKNMVDKVHGKNKTMGQVYSFEGCRGGYELLGPRNITCQLNGSWSSLPRCGKKCQNIVPTRNAVEIDADRKKKSWSIGEVRRYKCSGSLQLEGSDRVTCLENGTWSNPAPVCREVSCAIPTIDKMVDKVKGQSRRMNEVYSFQGCHRGYELIGPGIITCQPDRSWTELPKCRKMCRDIKPPHNVVEVGAVKNKASWSIGDFRRYMCRDTLQVGESDRIICLEDGTWTNTFPVCREIPNCPDIDPPLHGREISTNQKSSWEQGDTRRYQCDTLFQLEGTNQVECLRNGSWSQPYPVCKERFPTVYLKYDDIEYLIYGKPSDKSSYDQAKRLCSTIRANIAVIYSDDVTRAITSEMIRLKYTEDTYIGYVRDREGQWGFDTSNIVTRLPEYDPRYNDWYHSSPSSSYWFSGYHRCSAMVWDWKLINGEWVKRYPWKNFRCWKKKSFICQRNIPTPCDSNPCLNGGTCNNIRENRKSYYCSCFSRYEGKNCEQEILCRPPNLPEHMDTLNVHEQDQYTVGSVVSLVCSNNKIPSSESLTCLETGQWSETNLECRDIPNPCDSHPCLNGGNCNKTQGNGQTFDCYCSRGYKGNHCEQEIVCQPPNLPDQIDVGKNYKRDRYLVDDIVSVVCSNNKIPSSNSLTCLESGEWSETNLWCKARGCTLSKYSLPDLNMEIKGYSWSTLSNLKFVSGESVTVMCTDSKLLQSVEGQQREIRISCELRGTWTDVSGYTCESGCLDVPDLQRGTYSHRQAESYPIGHRMPITCDTGYTSTNSYAVCRQDRTWEIMNPCEANICSKPEVFPDQMYIKEKDAEFRFGTVLSLLCRNPSQSPYPDSDLTCLANGTWSHSNPVCKANRCRLSGYTLPQEEMFIKGYSWGELSGRKFEVGERFFVTCASPRFLQKNKDQHREIEITCQIGGMWTDLTDYSCKLGCPNLPAPKGGTYPSGPVQSAPFGEVVPIQCNEGFISTNPRAVCRRNRKWQIMDPCKVNSCAKPGVSDLPVGMNIAVEFKREWYSFGSEVLLVCTEKNKMPDQPATLICLETGLWSDTRSVCQVISCPPPEDPPNSVLRFRDNENQFLPGNELIFDCEHKYEPVETNVITCQDDGTWSESQGCISRLGCFLDESSFNDNVTVANEDFDKTLEFPLETRLEFHCVNPQDTLLPTSLTTCRGQNNWEPDYTEFFCVFVPPTKSCKGQCDQEQSTDGTCACDKDCSTRDDCCLDSAICNK